MTHGLGSRANGHRYETATLAQPLGEDTTRALKGTSLDCPAQRHALEQISPAIRQIFIKSAQAGEPISAEAYCEARGQSRENPLITAAHHATEEDLFEFLSLIEDPDNTEAMDIWRQAELNSLIWG